MKELYQKELYRIVDWQKNFFVMLSLEPKITGHLLVVSKSPYDDITELKAESDEAQSIFKAIIQWSKILKDCLRVEKVYALTMCDHYSLEELHSEKETTEHLHFHLLPRYVANRSERGETFLMRTGEHGFESRPFVLEQIKEHLVKYKGKKGAFCADSSEAVNS